jgi:4'-phosphopantetheinyl transferase
LELLDAPENVQVWRAALEGPGWPAAARLPRSERERAERFLDPRAASRWVASRWALRQALGSHLAQPAEAVRIELDAGGKPRLADRSSGLEFSLSHSGGVALIAIARERQVGVDVERIRPGRDVLALAERALAPRQAAAIRAARPAEREPAFYRAWVEHEARFKCLGAGTGDAEAAVTPIDAGRGYAAAVAVAASRR